MTKFGFRLNISNSQDFCIQTRSPVDSINIDDYYAITIEAYYSLTLL